MTMGNLQSNKILFLRSYPKAFYLDGDDKEGLESFLLRRGWINNGEEVKSLSKAGEGNMNCTLRVRTETRSFILKQSRPWVEKYPQISAPATRALIEGQFYRFISTHAGVAKYMPKLLGVDENSNMLCLEDLGETQDFTYLYSGQKLLDNELAELTDYLSVLHGAYAEESENELLDNKAMRTLNHEHIFDLPIRKNNGLELNKITPGLAEIAEELKKDDKYTNQVKKLGELYLTNGSVLGHGDYYPGSWLKTNGGVKIIDPEFCFFGFAEFDIGVFVSHLYLSQKIETDAELQIGKVLKNYENNNFDVKFAKQIAGVEIMRRLIGVAQLPLQYGLEHKRNLLNLSRRLVLE